MKCSDLPKAAYRYWTLWGRTGRYPKFWQFLGHGSLQDCERAAKSYRSETLVLPPMESPMMCKKHCLREDYP